MGYLEQIFGSELGLPARAVVALLLVLALIALTVWLVRRFGDTRAIKTGSRGRQQRLAVLDQAAVDARRRLVLIRRDNVEHLLLIGGPTDVVVEPNIVRGLPLAAQASPSRPMARPGAFEPAETEYESPLMPYPEPSYPEPERAAPPPQVQPQMIRPAMPEPPRPHARPTQRLEPQYADMAHRLEAALRKPQGNGDSAARSQPRSAPIPAAPRPPEPRVAPAAPPMRAPEPRPAPPVPPAQKSAADVFGSLEDEMASLLRPGGKTTQ